jgi:hypothetical protein
MGASAIRPPGSLYREQITEQFRSVFVDYNNSIKPAQVAAYLLGGAAVALLLRKKPEGDRVIAGILAMMWLWTGVGYHLLSFSAINKAAYIFCCSFSMSAIFSTLACIAVRLGTVYDPACRPSSAGRWWPTRRSFIR